MVDLANFKLVVIWKIRWAIAGNTFGKYYSKGNTTQKVAAVERNTYFIRISFNLDLTSIRVLKMIT